MTISASNILLELASFRTQSLASLFSSSAPEQSSGSSFADILGGKSADLAGAQSQSGRNMSLFDPESGYKMMTTINNSEASIKAQYAELRQLGSDVEHMEAVGEQLSVVDTSSTDADIISRMQGFVDNYNQWVDRFAPTVENGGVLDNIQAAEMSLFELEQSVRNVFVGAKDGFHGMESLGLKIDPTTRQASLDTRQLTSALAGNRSAAVEAIDEFSANFAKAADMLNAPNNVIPKQLDNCNRAIQFIASNRSSLQAEFGTGDAAQPSSQVAKALSAYEQAFAIS